MPMYEYQCEKCGHLLEVIQTFSDAPLTKCPECEGRLEKLLSASAIQFKGSGWYVTDYSDKESKKKKDQASKVKASGETASKDTSSSKSTEKKSDSATPKESKTPSSKGSDSK